MQRAVKFTGIKEVPKEEDDEDPDNTKNEIPVHTATVSVATCIDISMDLEWSAREGRSQVRWPETPIWHRLWPVSWRKVLCQAGQQVHANDPVIQLDDRLTKSAEEQAAAGLRRPRHRWPH